MTTWKLDLDADAMNMLQDFQDERDALRQQRNEAIADYNVMLRAAEQDATDFRALRQRVAILEADNKNCLNSVHEMLDQLAACEKERDEYQRIAHAQYTEWQNDIEKLAACGDERIAKLRAMLKTNAEWWYELSDDDKGDACLEVMK